MTGATDRNSDNDLLSEQSAFYRSHVDSDQEGDEENNLHGEEEHLDGKSSSIASSSTLHHTAHKHHLGGSNTAAQAIEDKKTHLKSSALQRLPAPHVQGQSVHGSAHHSHHHNHLSYNATVGLLMLIDGIGLSIITTATILEAFDLWEAIFDGYWGTNQIPSSLWLMGRTSQIIGLLFLIGHASSFQMFPNIERFGMCMLTLGPILNISAYYFFRAHDMHLTWENNRAWLTSETLEILGIGILDVSMIDMEEIYVLIAEVVGFLVLCCAAALQFEYKSANYFPSTSFRLEMVHSSECFGLIMLIVVAFGQYRMKMSKHEAEMKQLGHSRDIV
eukprot:gene33611-40658_t